MPLTWAHELPAAPAITFLLAAILALAASPVPRAAALPTEVHAIISYEAARLPGVPDQLRDPDVLGTPEDSDPQDQDITICQGTFDEDADRIPSTLFQLIRLLDPNSLWAWGTHFWNPFAGPEAGQLFLLNPAPPQNAYQRGSHLYEEAISLYPTDPEQAGYLLGRVSHLLEDMATPAHTHLDPHLSDKVAAFLQDPFLDADSFEHYMARNYISGAKSPAPDDATGQTRFENDFVPATLVPVSLAQLSDAGHPELGDVFRLFHSMALHAAMWDSNDADGTGPDGMGQGSLRGNHHIDDADCQRMAADLIPKAVAHVAALYRVFWRDTHPDAALPDLGTLTGDVNGDGTVGTLDLLRLIRAFDTKRGDKAFDAACDLNASGTVDVTDLQILITNFGQTR